MDQCLLISLACHACLKYFTLLYFTCNLHVLFTSCFLIYYRALKHFLVPGFLSEPCLGTTVLTIAVPRSKVGTERGTV